MTKNNPIYSKAITVCPDGCDPSMVMHLVPADPFSLKNATCRCLCCLTFWRVTPDARVIDIRWGIESKHKVEQDKDRLEQ